MVLASTTGRVETAMATYLTKLVAREEVARDTSAFHFEKPAGFEFVAGQYAFWTLIGPPETDNEGTSRSFTIASAPCEQDLMFATRMRNTAMKRLLKAMKPGDEIQVSGPFGVFTLDPGSPRPAVLLAG